MTIAEQVQQRDYPDHVCPPELERHGDLRQGWHGGAPSGHLMLVCEIAAACGCDVVGNGTLMHPVMIEPCSEHASAMYPSLVPAEPPVKVHIGFGSQPKDGTTSVEYVFATLAELNAFLLGVSEMDGWGDWSQFDEGPHYARNGEWWPE